MSRRVSALLACATFAVALAIYFPSLRGQPISDDGFLLGSPQVRELSAANLRAMFDPTGPLPHTYLNYAPLNALLHAVEIRLFGEHWTAYHLVNIATHAGVVLVFAALLLQVGLPRAAAWLGAGLFLVHPANVEAVAWITQLKTGASTLLAIGALLLHDRRPAAAAGLFALALLTKAHAAFAFPVLAVLVFTRGGSRATGVDRARWRWVAVWGLALLAFAALEIPIHRELGAAERPDLTADPAIHARSVLAIAARYAAMGLTGFGLSAFHETPLARDPRDAWWLAGLVLAVAVTWRGAHALRRRSPEAAFWIWLVAAFVPVSQLSPFRHLMGDRYLYVMLPGAIGALLFVAGDALARLRAPRVRRAAAALAASASVALGLAFAAHSHQRARIWRHPDGVSADAAYHYPDGIHAHLLRARQAAWLGDSATAVAALRKARARGWTWIGVLFEDPAFARIREQPEFRALVRELSDEMIRGLAAQPQPAVAQLQVLAQLHLWRGEPREAEAALERALALGGPLQSETREALGRLRAARPGGLSAAPAPRP